MTWWPDGDINAGRIPVSALEHYAYCPRQAALIHVEGVWTEDESTVRGQIAHDRVDKPGVRATSAPGMRQHYAVPIWSTQLGLYGRCDVVETGQGIAVPIEHKIGAYRPGGPADTQVVGQVVCLREMLKVDVPYGEVFTHADRRRHRVDVTADQITALTATVRALRQLLIEPQLPEPLADSRCRRCSLLDDCLPHALTSPRTDLFTPKPLGDWND